MKSIGDENDSNEGYTYRKRFLGEKEVPSRAYYGVQTLRAVENFPITGYRIHPSLITAMAIVKKRRHLQISILVTWRKTLDMKLRRQRKKLLMEIP